LSLFKQNQVSNTFTNHEEWDTSHNNRWSRDILTGFRKCLYPQDNPAGRWYMVAEDTAEAGGPSNRVSSGNGMMAE